MEPKTPTFDSLPEIERNAIDYWINKLAEESATEKSPAYGNPEEKILKEKFAQQFRNPADASVKVEILDSYKAYLTGLTHFIPEADQMAGEPTPSRTPACSFEPNKTRCA